MLIHLVPVSVSPKGGPSCLPAALICLSSDASNPEYFVAGAPNFYFLFSIFYFLFSIFYFLFSINRDENDNSSIFSLINFALLNQSSPWPGAGIKSGLGWNLPWRSLNHSAREHGQDPDVLLLWHRWQTAACGPGRDSACCFIIERHLQVSRNGQIRLTTGKY